MGRKKRGAGGYTHVEDLAILVLSRPRLMGSGCHLFYFPVNYWCFLPLICVFGREGAMCVCGVAPLPGERCLPRGDVGFWIIETCCVSFFSVRFGVPAVGERSPGDRARTCYSRGLF